MPNHFTYWYGLFLIASFESSSVEHPLDQRWKLHICFYFYLRNFSLILYSRRDQITTYLFPSSLLTHKQFGDVVHKFECQFLRSLPDKVFFLTDDLNKSAHSIFTNSVVFLWNFNIYLCSLNFNSLLNDLIELLAASLNSIADTWNEESQIEMTSFYVELRRHNPKLVTF